jgi:hypothetical protein
MSQAGSCGIGATAGFTALVFPRSASQAARWAADGASQPAGRVARLAEETIGVLFTSRGDSGAKGAPTRVDVPGGEPRSGTLCVPIVHGA